MNSILDSAGLDIPCPGCGEEIHETIGRVKHNPELVCPGCGQIVAVDADQLRSGIAAAEKSLDDFGRMLGKFGK